MATKGESLLNGLQHMLKRSGKGPAHPCPAGRVRGRPQHRDHAGQGGQADAALSADPVQPGDRQGAGDAADHLPALDQPLSTSSTSTRRRASSNGRWSRGSPSSSSPGSRPTRASPTSTLDDYVLAEVEAIDAVREALGVESVHAIGYCVAGTMLAAALALLAARGEADKVASATFFTAQVDFSEAGDLKLFIGDEQMELIRQLSADKGYLDGRYMAATFNLLQGPRPDLVLRHQQLPARRGLSAVRPAALERRHHQPAGRLAPRLSAAALPGEQAGPARRADDRRHADRPAAGEDAHLCAGGPRGSYRARAERLEDHPPFRRAAALRAGGLGPYRRRGEPARGRQISILDQRGEGGRRSSSSSPARPRPRAAGGRTGSAGSGAFPTRRCSPPACACRARGGSRRSRMRRGAM